MSRSWPPSPLGRDAERRVRRHYRLRGYRIVATNARAGGNELDIIARRGGCLVFCEVKARAGPGYGHPLEAVGPEKARRIRRAAEAWLAGHPDLSHLEVGFEVAAVQGRTVERRALF
jgi:putative endonuclease